jgi:hypothetical protein
MARKKASSPLSALATAILALNYSDMMDLAQTFSEAIAEREVWPHGVKTPEDFARLLYGWAEGTEK